MDIQEAQGHAMRILLFLAISSICLAEGQVVIVVVGAPGEPEYELIFQQSANHWQQACQKANIGCILIGQDDRSKPLEDLKATLQAQETTCQEPLWLVLIGHGTYDGRSAKFNLKGPDLDAAQLAQWLEPFNRTLVLINTTSCSSPFLTSLSGPNRVIITATRSGFESSVTRFGSYLATAIADPNADLDKDGQTSVLEAFIIASNKTSQFYSTLGRLATEHALLDDNGDRLGTPAEWFSGLRPTRKPADRVALDGYRAHQIHLLYSPQEMALPQDLRSRRDQLELEVIRLRDYRDDLSEAEYLDRLQVLLLELARIYLGPG